MKTGLAAIGFAGLLLCQDVAASLFTSAYLNIDRQELNPPGPNVSIFDDLQQSSSPDNSPIGVAINPSVSYVRPSAVARAREGVLRVVSTPGSQDFPAMNYCIWTPSGTDDEHTTWPETERIFAAAQQPKELWAVDGAAHVDLYSYAPAAYKARILRFFSLHLRSSG